MGVEEEDFWRHTSETLLAESDGVHNVGVWAIDEHGKTVFITDVAAEILGYTPEQMLGHRLLEYIHPDERDLAERRLARRKSGLAEQFLVTYAHVTGNPVSVRISSRPIFDGKAYKGTIATLTRLEASLHDPEVADELARSQQQIIDQKLLTARLEMVADNLSEIVAIVGPDLRFEWVSNATQSILGFARHEMIGALVADYLHPDELEQQALFVADLLAAPGSEAAMDIRLARSDGTWVIAEGKAFNNLNDPDLGCIFLNATDVTEKRQAEIALRQSEDRYRGIVENAGDAIVTIDDGMITSFNSAAERLTGIVAAGAIGLPIASLFPASDIDDNELRIERLQVGEAVEFETIGHRRDGRTFPTHVTVIAASQPDRFTLFARDLTDQRAYESQLEQMASRDALTGLPNRLRIMEHIDQAMARARRHETTIALLFLDLDRFKFVNDSLGHDAGDRLLLAAAARIGAAIRDSDTLGRLGGDEFVVLCEDVGSPTEVSEIAKRIQVAFEAPFALGRTEAFVTASIGIALSDGVSDRPSDLLRNADATMYQAKRSGRNRIELFDESTRVSAHARLDFESALRRCVERQELQLLYQPIFDLKTGLITGAEALARWDRGPFGIVGPDQFIRTAEEIGIIGSIGTWVCERAFRDCAEWQSDAPGATVGVNISATQLLHPDIADNIATIAKRAGLCPDMICLEVAERGLIDQPSYCQAALKRLSKTGFRMALDNFGTGILSLLYLRKFSFETVKVDHSLVESLATDEKPEVLAAVVQLAHNLGLNVVAEGIETHKSLAALKDAGCEMGQGYLLGHPGSIDDLRARMCTGRVNELRDSPLGK